MSGSVTAQTPVDQLSTVGEPVQPSQSAPGHGLGRAWPTNSSCSWTAPRWRSSSSTKRKSAREHDCTLAITCTMYLAHTHQAQADRMGDFFLCAVGSTMSRQLYRFGKPVVRKAGPYRSPSNRYERFINAYVAAIPVCLWWRPSAKQTIHGESRGMEETRKKWRLC